MSDRNNNSANNDGDRSKRPALRPVAFERESLHPPYQPPSQDRQPPFHGYYPYYYPMGLHAHPPGSHYPPHFQPHPRLSYPVVVPSTFAHGQPHRLPPAGTGNAQSHVGAPQPPAVSMQAARANNSHYQLDGRASDCQTLSAAKAQLERLCGGFYQYESVIKLEGTRPSSSIWRFNCMVGSCMWRAQIKEVRTSSFTTIFCTYTKPGNKHNHALSKEPVNAFDQYGLHALLKDLAIKYLEVESDKGRSMLEVTPDEVMASLSQTVRRNHPSHRGLVEGEETRQHLSRQLSSFIQQRRSVHYKRIIGVQKILTNDSLLRVISRYRLVLPKDYAPTISYESPEAIARALGVDTHTMFIADLSGGDLFERYRTVIVPDKPRRQKEFKENMEQCFYSFSPVGLFHLLKLCLRRRGTSQVYADGTGGICLDLSTLVVFATSSVKYRTKQDAVTTSMRPIAYMHVGGERLHCHLMFLYSLNELSLAMYRLPLIIDHCTSDHSNSFISAAMNYYKRRKALLLEIGEARRRRSVDLRAGKRTLEPVDVRREVIELSQQQYELSQEQHNRHKEEQMRLKKLPSNMKDIDGEPIVMAWNGVPLDIAMFEKRSSVKGLAACFFHLLQMITKRKGFAGQFKTKTMLLTKEKSFGAMETAYEHLCLIHKAKTVAQRSALMYLVIKKWCMMGEFESAKMFYEQYCVAPYCNWNYLCAEQAGCHPTNSPLEGFNHDALKGGNSSVKLNLSLEGLIVDTLPKLHLADSFKRLDSATIECPRLCSQACVVLTAYMREDVDVKRYRDENEGTTYWICNTASSIGVPITEERINDMLKAEDGMHKHFARDTDPIHTARRMVKCTRSLCRLRRNTVDRAIYGDCENCIKYLGFNCPGASFVRSKEGLHTVPVEERRAVRANSRNKALKAQAKGKRRMYTGGLPKTAAPPKCTPKMIQSLADYTATLFLKQLDNVVENLALRSLSTGELLVGRCSKSQLEDVLQDFHKNPTAYRVEEREALIKRNKALYGKNKETKVKKEA